MPNTPHYSWPQPTIGANLDTWGDVLNAQSDAIDAEMFLKANKDNPTFTGNVTIDGNLDVNGIVDVNSLRFPDGSTLSTATTVQTPWAQNIDGNSKRLDNASGLAIGTVDGVSGRLRITGNTTSMVFIDTPLATGSVELSMLGAAGGTGRLTAYGGNHANTFLRGNFVLGCTNGDVIFERGVERARFAPGGFGIGTPAPAVGLDLQTAHVAFGGQLRIGALDVTQITFYKSDALTISSANQKGSLFYDMPTNVMELRNWNGGAFGVLALNGSGGLVGIGTKTPGAKLHVAADTFRQLYLTANTDPTLKQMRLGYDTSNNTGVLEVQLNGAGTSLLLQPAGGYVGIGSNTGNLSGNLDIVGGSRPYDHSSAGVGTLRLATGTAPTDDSLLFGVFTGVYSWIQAIKAGTVQRPLLINPAGGSVGIGTTTPISRFTVAGPGNNETGGAAFTPSFNVHNSICIMDTTASSGVGGAVIFGAVNAKFAAIRGIYTNGTGFGSGHLSFYVRINDAGEGMPEIMRLMAGSGYLQHFAMCTTNPGAGTKIIWADPADGYRLRLAF